MEHFLTEPISFTFQLDEATQTKSGALKLKGLFQMAETANANRRIYPRHILEREVKKLMPAIKEKRIMGEIDHPNDPKIHLEKVSHVITELSLEGNKVFGTIEVLKTPAGEILKGLVESGVKLGISSRGTGSLKTDESRSCNVVQDDFNLITWDIVGDPSTPGAWVNLSESKLYVPANFSEDSKIIKREKAFVDTIMYAADELFKV